MFEINIENLKTLKSPIFRKNHQSFPLFIVSVVINVKKIFKEEEPNKILKIIGLSITQKSIRIYIVMSEENISREFKLKNIDETRNYLIEEINQNELISNKHKEVYIVLNYI